MCSLRKLLLDLVTKLEVNTQLVEGVDETASKIFETLMGDEVLARKNFIQTHAKTVKNLDI